MIGTGVAELDEFLGGGIPKGKSLVFYIQPGVDGEAFGMQMAYNSLKNGGSCVLVVSSTIPDSIKSQFTDLSWDIQSFNDRFFCVDAYNPLISAPSKEKYVVSSPDNIEEFNKIIMTIIKELHPCTIVFGCLSTIMDLCGEKETIEAVKTWNKTAMLHDHNMVYNFTAWPYSEETLNIIERDLFNAVIAICETAERVVFGPYFRILKSDWVENKRETIILPSPLSWELNHESPDSLSSLGAK
ncbi:MAG TPA: RAD55 family ATPase [Candidatus Methanoperedens sp.]